MWDGAGEMCAVKHQVIPSAGGAWHSEGVGEYNDIIEDRSGEGAFLVSVNSDGEAGFSTYERINDILNDLGLRRALEECIKRLLLEADAGAEWRDCIEISDCGSGFDIAVRERVTMPTVNFNLSMNCVRGVCTCQYILAGIQCQLRPCRSFVEIV